MRCARLRLHGDLPSLLRRDRRGEARAWPLAEGATIKHLLESAGVPHTEVGAVAIGGRPAALGMRPDDGDLVEAWPLVPAPPPCPRFLADAHLGALARRLRLLGFDTLLAGDQPDRALAARAAADDRILLSRDRALLQHRLVRHGRFVRATRLAGQLDEVVRHYGLRGCMHPFTRCLECNAPLASASADEVAAALPPRVAAQQRAFTRCTGCGRVFWPGTHWRRLRAVVDALSAA